MKKQILQLLAIVLAGLIGQSPAWAARAKQPNIIVILADDLGYECIGADGGQTYKTPVLDKMAQGGMRFEHCYAQPLCTPSRVQIMTGIYNVRNYTTFGHLEEDQTTFAHLLKKAGYVTGIAGKWQLGGEGRKMGELASHFGFDESFLCSWYSYYWDPDIVINGVTKVYRPQDYGPDVVHEQVCSFIERNKTRPFFLYYPISLPHDPFLPTPDSGVKEPWRFGTNPEKQGPKGTPDMFKKGDGRYYGDMVAYMDKLVGRLLAKLDAEGLRDNTIVMFTGDNGSPTGRALLNGRTVLGGKGKMTDAGTHAPLIVSGPTAMIKTGVCKELVDFSDFLPTICEAAGVEVPAALKVDGRSFLPQLRGERGNPRPWCYCWYTKYPANTPPEEWARNQRYKLYRSGEFYDVCGDPDEQHPLTGLSAEAQSVRTLLQQALDQYRDARPAEWVAKEAQAKAKSRKPEKKDPAE